MSRRNGHRREAKPKLSPTLRVSLAQLELEASEASTPAREVRWVSTRDTCHNKLERDYYDHLVMLRRAGEIHDFRYEPCSFRLGNDCRYEPDFMILYPDGRTVFHETKGRMFAHSRVKIKTFVTLYPFFPLYLVERSKNGRFDVTRFDPITLL